MEFVDTINSGETLKFNDDVREMVDVEKAQLLIKKFDKVTSPISLDLSNKSYSDEASKIIGEFLIKFKSIVKADIHDMIAGRPEDEALRSFSSICNSLKGNQLIELDISDNALGAKGIEACSDLLNGTELKKIYILNNGISKEAAALIATILLDKDDSNNIPDLDTFHFYNNMCGNGGAQAISKIVSKMPNLTSFRYSATRTNAEGCALIAKAINNCTKLKHIDVADNSFGEEVGEQLAEGIANNSDLEYLSLRDAMLGDGGGNAIMNSLKNLNKIQILDISGNELTEDFIDQVDLIDDILNKKDLIELYIDDNELGTDAAIKFADRISICKPQKLVKLSICTCEITAAGAYSIAKACTSLPSFKLLLLDGNEVCERGINLITDLLQEATM